MKITIIFDNCLDERGLRTSWVFSSLIEVGNAPPLLSDAGADGATLLYNMKELGIDPKRIGTIVISHRFAVSIAAVCTCCSYLL